MKVKTFIMMFTVYFFAPATMLLANDDCLQEAEFYRLNIIRDLPNEKTKRNLINCLLLLSDIHNDQIVLYSPVDGTLVSKEPAPVATGGGGFTFRCIDLSKCGPEVSTEERTSSLGKMCKDWCGTVGVTGPNQRPSIRVLRRMHRENLNQ